MAAAEAGARIGGASPAQRSRPGRIRPPHRPGLPDPRRPDRRRGRRRTRGQGCRQGRRHDHAGLGARPAGPPRPRWRRISMRPKPPWPRRLRRPPRPVRAQPVLGAQGGGVTPPHAEPDPHRRSRPPRLRRPGGAAGRRPGSTSRRDLRPAGPQRRGQDHADSGHLRAAEARRRARSASPAATPSSTAPRAALLGLVPQSLALYGHLTVAENLDVFARLCRPEGRRAAEGRDRPRHGRHPHRRAGRRARSATCPAASSGG